MADVDGDAECVHRLHRLAAKFGQALPDAGIATCVTDEFEADLPGRRQNLIDGTSTSPVTNAEDS